jgi:threonine/homoserine/homoserine lactone efflux protein
MGIELWIAYLLAVALILIIPGPTIILVVSQAVTYGRTSVAPPAAGVVLGGTFLILAAVNAALYALFASRLREAIRKTTVRKWLNRCGGTALMGAGLFTAGMQRGS